MKARAADLLPPLVALLAAAVAGDLLILALGQSPAEVWGALLAGTWGNGYGFGQVLYKATVLTCTGLGVAIPLRAGLLNVGAEGQLAAGGFAAALAGLALPAGTPTVLAATLAIAAAMTAGAAAGLVPGVLKARFGAHEVLTTILLNFVVLAFLGWAVGLVRVPETLHTLPIHAGHLPRLEGLWPALHGSAASAALPIVAIAALATGVFLFRTGAGLDLCAVGLQPAAAAAAGVEVGATWIRALVLGGALAGLGGVASVLGHKGWYEEGFGAGAGFLGIAVAFLGRAHPAGVVIAALLFATLSQGGLAIHALVPRQMVEVLEAVVILTVVAAVPEARRLLSLSEPGRAP